MMIKKPTKFKILVISYLIILIIAICHCSPKPITQPQPSLPPPSPVVESPTPDTVPPETQLVSAPKGIIDQDLVTLQWTGADDRTIPSNLIYSYYLTGHDADFSPFTKDISCAYSDLPDGSYEFYVKSQDEAGNTDPSPATAEFTIQTAKKPTIVPVIPVDSSHLVVANSDVSHIAVGSDSKTVYAIDSFSAKLYKSEQSGFGWADSSKGIGGAATWVDLTVAPDDARIVAVITDSGTEVYLSVNSGTSFSRKNLSSILNAGERASCLAISPLYGNGQRELAIGTVTGNGNGRILINISNNIGATWTDSSTGVVGWLPGNPPILGTDVFSIEYSHSFAADGTLLAIVASGPAPDTDDTYLYIGLRDLATTNIMWNSSPGYPVEICQQGSDSPGTPLTFADIALPSDYIGSTPAHRHVYTCWTDNPIGSTSAGNPNDAVYRLDDFMVSRLMGQDVACSLAHYGRFSRGKLLAGALNAKTSTFSPGPHVYCSFNPQSNYPTWQSSQKPPTGPGQAKVFWSPDGSIAYCGTSAAAPGSHDQSAFSVSRDNGLTWNQTGIIDL
jgi:hypothetical protein